MKFVGNYTIEGVPNGTLKECIKYCNEKQNLGIDIETSAKYPKGTYDSKIYKGGLDPYLTNVVMLQLGDLEEQFIVDVRDLSKEDIKSLKTHLFDSYEGCWVGHNLQFEYKHLNLNYNFDLNKCWDTMLCDQILYNGLDLRMGLADLSGRYLGTKKVEEVDLFNIDDPTPLHTLVEQEYIDKSIRMGFINIGNTPFTYEQVA